MKSPRDVGQILKSKGYGYHGVGPDGTAYDALGIMAEKNIGALLVVEGHKLIGVFSERDYARKVVLQGRSSKSTTVREIMSSQPVYVGPGATIRDCMVLMTDHHIRHVPVLENETILGVVSIGDVVHAIISDQESTIEELEEYIAGTGYRA